MLLGWTAEVRIPLSQHLLVDAPLGAGSHHIETSRVQAGVYFVRLSQGSDVKVKRAVVLE